MDLTRTRVWGYTNQFEEDRLTTKFLELLLQHGCIWKPDEIRFQKAEKQQFLLDFNKFVPDVEHLDDWDVSTTLDPIQEYYDILASSKKEDKLRFPWFSLAFKLFQGTRIDSAVDISVQEFKKRELINRFNHLIDVHLVEISNRNLHLKQIHKEFLEFSRFINQPKNKAYFHVFLTPVFQHLYLLVHCNSGKSDAMRFIKYFEHLRIPSQVIRSLVQCKTSEEVQDLINRQARISVKLSSNAYHILMNWFRECFSKSLEMFVILRVLHENFHVDIFHDKDDQEFSALELDVLQIIDEFLTDYHAKNDKKKSGGKTKLPKTSSTKTCQAPQSEDVLTQKMSDLQIGAEMPETPKPSESNGAEMPETPKPSESNVGASDFEVKSSMFKLRDSARKYVEDIRNSGMDIEQKIEALLNPPDFRVPVSSVTDYHAKNEASTKTCQVTQGNVEEIIQQLSATTLKSEEKESVENQEVKDMTSENVDSQEVKDRTPESVESQEVKDRVSECVESQEVKDIASESVEGQEVKDRISGSVESQENKDKTPESAVSQEVKDRTFKNSYRTNFHSVYPITISGKDVLCSSDVSPDLSYVALGFESCKICTWRLTGNDFKLKQIGTLRGHKAIVYALSIDSNLKRLVSGSHDCTVKIWDIEKSELIYEILEHSAPVYDVCVSPNSRYFLSASEDRHVKLFWYDDVYPARDFAGHSLSAINCVRFHPNCAYFACAASDGNLFLFKINDDNRPVRIFTKHAVEVYTLSFSPCGKHLASADADGILIVWDILKCTPIIHYKTEKGIRSISYDTSGSLIAALFYYTSWKVYNVDDVKDGMEVIVQAETAGVPKSVHFSTDNKMVIIQYIEADQREIDETKDVRKTQMQVVGVKKEV